MIGTLKNNPNNNIIVFLLYTTHKEQYITRFE